jgi:DNA-directed RNA polymerase subunit M/transcription elongation factor TFIIS
METDDHNLLETEQEEFEIYWEISDNNGLGGSEDLETPEDLENLGYCTKIKEEKEEKEEEKKHVYTSRAPHHYTKKAFREAIVKALSAKYESPKNGEILEKHVYNATITLARLKGIPLKSTDKNFQLTYASIAYDTLSSNSSIKDIIEQLKTGKIEWKAPQFNDILAARSAEEADHTKDVVEGIHECSDCKRNGKVFNKTRNVQIQTRGGDEGMTTFVTCVMCRKMWKQAN